MLITFEQLFLFLSVYIPLLLTVAFFVLFERKFLASVQRRVGPKIIGLWGLLQSIADGLKLLLKQYISPSKINQTIFFYSPILCFTFSFSSWTAIPFTFINVLCEINSQVLLVLSLSSLNVYTIIFSGWSSNSKYALFGSLRAAAQVISYELALTTSLLPVVLSSGSLNFSSIVNQQQNIYYFFLFFPVSFIFFITAIAETNRPPFDLPEAEAEIVAGYNVEYSSMPFAFFFLAEYCNVLTMCGSWSIFFGGGWLNFIGLSLIPIIFWFSFKTCFLSSLFVFIRGILPRYRYDQLMSLGWKVLFPFAFSFFVFSAGSFCFFDILPDNSNNLFIDQYDLNKILYPTYSKTINVLGSFFFMYKKNLINFVYSENLEFFLLYYLVGVILLVFFIIFFFAFIFSIKNSEPTVQEFPDKWYRYGAWFALIFFFIWAVGNHVYFAHPLLERALLTHKAAYYLVLFYLVWPLFLMWKIVLPGIYAGRLLPSFKKKEIKSYPVWFFFSGLMTIFVILIFCFILLHLAMFLNKSYKYIEDFSSKYNFLKFREEVELQRRLHNETINRQYFSKGGNQTQNNEESAGTLFADRVFGHELRPDTYVPRDDVFTQVWSDFWDVLFSFAEKSTLNSFIVLFTFIFFVCYIFFLISNKNNANWSVAGRHSYSHEWVVYDPILVKYHSFEAACYIFIFVFLILCFLSSKQATWDELLIYGICIGFLFMLPHYMWRWFTFITGKSINELTHAPWVYMQLQASKKLGYNPNTHWIENGKVYTNLSRDELIQRKVVRICPKTGKLLPLVDVAGLKEGLNSKSVIANNKFPLVSRYYSGGIAFGSVAIHEKQTLNKNEAFKVEVIDLNEQAKQAEIQRKKDQELHKKIFRRAFKICLAAGIIFWGSYYVIVVFF